MAKSISLLGLVLVLSACGGSSVNSTAMKEFELQKLEGRWECVDEKSNQIEEWRMIEEDELSGTGYVLEDGDTTFIEFLSIKKMEGKLTYFAQISDSEVSEVVPFTLNFQSPQKIEFINNSQDFPKKIGYEVISDQSMQSYIEGPRDGQNIRILFDFIRKQ